MGRRVYIIGRVGGAEQEHSLSKAEVNKARSSVVIKCMSDRYVLGFASALRFHRSQILYRLYRSPHIVQELCESRGGRPGLAVLTSLLVSVDIKLY